MLFSAVALMGCSCSMGGPTPVLNMAALCSLCSVSYKGEKKKREPETARGVGGVWEKWSREEMIKIHCIHG